MTARGSPEWYRQRREGFPDETPALPMKPLDELLAEALERLQRLADEHKAKTE